MVRDSLVVPAMLVPPQPPSAFPQPTLDAYTVASSPRPSPADPFPPLSPFAIRLFTTLQAVTTSSPSSPVSSSLLPTLRCLRRHPTTDPNPWRPFALSRGCESRAAVYMEACEGGCTEASSSPRQVATPAKFPRRPCRSPIYLTLSPYLCPLSLLFLENLPREKERAHTMSLAMSRHTCYFFCSRCRFLFVPCSFVSLFTFPQTAWCCIGIFPA